LNSYQQALFYFTDFVDSVNVYGAPLDIKLGQNYIVLLSEKVVQFLSLQNNFEVLASFPQSNYICQKIITAAQHMDEFYALCNRDTHFLL
jgi:hypothetical protein